MNQFDILMTVAAGVNKEGVCYVVFNIPIME